VLPEPLGRVLWISNSASLGGSGLWVYDALRSLPEWEHYVLYVAPFRSALMARKFAAAGARLAYVPRLTRAFVESLDPSLVVLSNTDASAIEGGSRCGWLTASRPVVTIHHGVIERFVPNAYADIFVSRNCLARHEGRLPPLRRQWILPPGIRTADFTAIPRSPEGLGRCVTGRISSGNRRKFPRALFEILDRAGCPSVVVGGQRHYGRLADPRRFAFPPVGGREPAAILRDLDIFVYRSDMTETWCRAVTEAMAAGLPVVADRRGGIAEQIEDGVDGFLCDDDDAFVAHIRRLAADPLLRFEVGSRAREKAVREFDIGRFRETVRPLLLDHTLKAAS
jgi:glycosyltransferase involved in cell wall biosynthesis